MREKIRKACKQIEKDNNVKILFAIENGSRAWRMESTDSDYDIRFVFVRPLEDYICLRKNKEVIDRFYDKEGKECSAKGCYLDMVGFDLFKYLGLLMKSNPTTIEWLISDIVYYGRQNALFRKIILKNFRRGALYYHYRSLALQNYSKYIQSGSHISYKKYLYALRGLFNAEYVVQFDKVPLIGFLDVVKEVKNVPLDVKKKVREIVKIKKRGTERDEISRLRSLDKFIESFLRRDVGFKEEIDSSLIEILEKEVRKILLK
jgi:uncharacterized protein